ncbi:MAG: hypothetical protein CMD92_02380 [Gammaproteobacteria bacterium]|nr:hypothetical protein [Gammaproteobacteria bacterium]|tara:strand:+ start:388 stop:945 length:558 start_codon:yes stop_codon:yes gene_type:complete
MSDKFHDAYAQLLTRRRWKLIEAVLLLHGIFVQTNSEFGMTMERFFHHESSEKSDDFLETGRLSNTLINRMLKLDVSEAAVSIRISDWEKLPYGWHEVAETRNSIESFWQLLNSKADIKKCEVCYIDESGKWYAFAPESMWSSEYLLAFAEKLGIDVKWLVSEIKKHQRVPNQKALAMALAKASS